MKEQITKFDFDAAFKALDEIDIPKVKGLRANRVDLHEACKRSDKFEALFEDYYDVADSTEMEAAQANRKEDIAQAKLSRIEKIVDLDADSAEDLLPSYVGKTIIQCPNCMTLFYKDKEDLEPAAENPDVVNVGEKCQHCGNDNGYSVIGKVAAEDENTEEENFATEAEELPDENIDLEAAPEEEPTEQTEETSLEDVELDEVPTEEETKESLNKSKFLKDARKNRDNLWNCISKTLDRLGESLNESADSELNKKLAEHNEYIKTLQDEIKKEEDAVNKSKNEFIKKMHQSNLDSLKAALDAAIPEEVKSEVPVETEIPDADEIPEDAIEGKEDVEAVESLNKSKMLKNAEKNILNTKNHSENLSLNEDFDEDNAEDVSDDDFEDAEPMPLRDVLALIRDTADEIKDAANVDEEQAESIDEVVQNKVEELCPECDEETAEEVEEDLTEDARADLIAFANGLDSFEESFKETAQESCKNKQINECDKKLTEDSVSDAEFKAMLNNPLYYEGIEQDDDAPLVEKTNNVGNKISEEDAEEDFDEITDESLNKHITNFLTEVYSNVKSFNATNCELNKDNLIIEGKITFNSGKSKRTEFNFTRKNNTFKGINESLSNDTEFTMNYSVKDKVMTVENLKYKYTVNKNLVEGCTRK